MWCTSVKYGILTLVEYRHVTALWIPVSVRLVWMSIRRKHSLVYYRIVRTSSNKAITAARVPWYTTSGVVMWSELWFMQLQLLDSVGTCTITWPWSSANYNLIISYNIETWRGECFVHVYHRRVMLWLRSRSNWQRFTQTKKGNLFLVCLSHVS